jgi:hypothetical protein
MQRVRLLRGVVSTSILGGKAVLRRTVFTVEGPGKGKGVPCVTEGDREQEEVKKLKNINMYDHYRKNEYADVTRCLGVAVQLGILERRQQILTGKSYRVTNLQDHSKRSVINPFKFRKNSIVC